MLNKTSRLSVFTQGSDLSYPGQPTRNSQLSNLGTGLLLAPAVSFSPVISLSAYLGSERPHMDTNAARASTDRDIRGVNASVNTSLTDKTSLTLSSQWQTSEYRDTNAIFLVKRDDTYKSLGLSLGYQYNNDFSLSAGWDYSETNSNISINAYHRNRFSLTARYDF
ncbi:MAG: surface lipoprotein assembly modifier, partial [Gammaproteobacteria bacterium]